MKTTLALLAAGAAALLAGCTSAAVPTTSVPAPTVTVTSEPTETSLSDTTGLSAEEVLDLIWEAKYTRDICPLYRMSPGAVRSQAYSTSSIDKAADTWGLDTKDIVDALMDRLEEEC